MPEYLTTFENEAIFQLTEFEGVCHAFMALRDKPETETVHEAYNTLVSHLKLNKFEEHGVTILLHNEWIFIAPLTDPVCVVNEVPTFIDPLAYAGIFNQAKEEYQWP